MTAHRFPILFSALFALAVLWAPPAQAHDFDPERQLVVQVFESHVDILVLYTEAPGKRTDFFSAKFGLGAGGEIGEFLDQLAGRAFLPRMLDGLEFEIAGEHPHTNEPELRFEDEDGRLMAAAYVRYDLDELDDHRQRTFIVRARDHSFLPTRTIVYGGGDLQLVDERGTTIDPPLDFQLRGGDEHRATFAHPER